MPETTDPQPDLPARLEAVLTERFTELGNPFSRMRLKETGPDGWPSTWEVGPRQVADVLRELLAATPVPSAPTDRAGLPSSFVLWLDASDGSVPTHDGIVWPDGAVTLHHRHFGYTTTHPDPESARRSAHGDQGRIVWPEVLPTDRAAFLREAANGLAALGPLDSLVSAPAAWTEAIEALRRMADQIAEDELRRLAVEASAPSRAGGGGRPGEAEADFTESVIYEVVGDWGVDSADSAEEARAAVAKWLREYPKCGAYAQQRIVRDWPDGSEFYGPWTELPDAPTA